MMPLNSRERQHPLWLARAKEGGLPAPCQPGPDAKCAEPGAKGTRGAPCLDIILNFKTAAAED